MIHDRLFVYVSEETGNVLAMRVGSDVLTLAFPTKEQAESKDNIWLANNLMMELREPIALVEYNLVTVHRREGPDDL